MHELNGELLGAVEAGGTKIVCAIAGIDGVILDQVRIPTGDDAASALAAVSSFFAHAQALHGHLAAVGIGSFGPLSLNPAAHEFGAITTTSKRGWSGVNVLASLRESLPVPLALDTDVNCAAIAELLFGAGKGLDSLCYVTIGTGIGVGAIVNGAPFGGANHLEAGHMLLRRVPGDEQFAGVCPFHGDCAEGLASGPAMKERWGCGAEELAPDQPGWAIEAEYVATLCTNLTYSLRPQRIILGGGVMEHPGIVDRVAQRFPAMLAGYDRDACERDPHRYLTRPAMGSQAGIYGALALAWRSVHGIWPATWTVA